MKQDTIITLPAAQDTLAAVERLEKAVGKLDAKLDQILELMNETKGNDTK